MQHMICLAAVCTLSLGSTALADGKIFVPLPDMAPMAANRAEGEAFLKELNIVTVLGMNCSNASLSEAEHSLITDSADLLAYGQFHISVAEADDLYSKPAFDYLDTDPEACARAPERIDSVLRTLEGLGGSLVPYADQEKAYVEWRALMDSIGN